MVIYLLCGGVLACRWGVDIRVPRGRVFFLPFSAIFFLSPANFFLSLLVFSYGGSAVGWGWSNDGVEC